MPISLRLDEKTDRLLTRLSRIQGRSRSEVIRLAIRRLGQDEDSGVQAPYPLLEPFIGRVRGGPADLSEQTGERFRELLTARLHRRS